LKIIRIFFSVSIQRLRHALYSAIKTHETLHSSITWDFTSKQWIQQIEPLNDEGFSLVIDKFSDYHNNIEDLVQGEYALGIHDVAHGRMVRLHIVSKSNQNAKDKDELIPGDIIIFNIRHEAIDGTSVSILFDTLKQAYSSTEEPMINPNSIRYLDYMLYLQQCDLSSSFAYWNEQMVSFNFARHFNRIPIDRP